MAQKTGALQLRFSVDVARDPKVAYSTAAMNCDSFLPHAEISGVAVFFLNAGEK
jgi:hypothetical protein